MKVQLSMDLCLGGAQTCPHSYLHKIHLCQWLCFADPAPPTGVLALMGTECNSADVSWSPSTVNYIAVIGNYSVRYRLRGSSGGYTTVYSPITRITLRGLDPGAEYDVEVAAVDLCGRMSGFSDVAQFNLQGTKLVCKSFANSTGCCKHTG